MKRNISEYDVVDFLKECNPETMNRIFRKCQNDFNPGAFGHLYDTFYDEWFEKVKEKYTLNQARELIKV